MKIKLSEALKLNFSNKYHIEELEKAKIRLDLINKFYPCECEVNVSGEYLDHIRFYLINNVCKITIHYHEYKKRYTFHCDEKFVNLDYHQIQDIYKESPAPQGVGVLSTKKIENWVKREQEVYLALVEKDGELTNKVSAFLKTLENEDVRWFKQDVQGEMIKNGIKFSFKIENGYIYRTLELHYEVPSTLESFKLLSNNKYS